jgi:hypothetical protein
LSLAVAGNSCNGRADGAGNMVHSNADIVVDLTSSLRALTLFVLAPAFVLKIILPDNITDELFA